MSAEPLVSVFIRVRDEATALRHVLENLRRQELDAAMEVVVLDNESVDGSGRVALEKGARVFTLPRALFGYGRALNVGVSVCQGQIVVLLSAHSIPQHEGWLASLIAPIREDPAISAAFCRQVPNGQVSRLERRRFACFPTGDTIMDRSRFLQECANGSDPYEAALFSNSACALRRSDAVTHPFRDLLYAEDRAFAVDCLMAGGKVAYVYGAVVSYERGMTWKSAYHVARRAQVSKRLIRELAATYTGTRFRCERDTMNRLVRAAFVVPGLVVRTLMSLWEHRHLRRRSIRYAFRSTGATIGLAVGALRWRRHLDTLSCDTARLDEARQHCSEIHLHQVTTDPVSPSSD